MLYLAKRLCLGFMTLWVASIVVFTCLEIVPGDPAQLILGLNATPEAVESLRQELGLNLSKPERYWDWATGLLHGDLGKSYTYGVPVADLVAERIVVSLPLALLALTLATCIALPIGLLTASRRGTLLDGSIMGMTQLGVAIPNFWFAILLVYIFAVWLRWVPAGGFPGWEEGFWPALKALALPAIALALPQAAILARVTRSALLEILDEDFIRTARAKGLPKSHILWRHALRNALVPVVTIMGLQFAFLLAGTIIIENVFYLPGLGRLVFQAISQRDLIVVESVVMLLVASVILINILVDIAYGVIDPRIRLTST